MQQQSSLPWWRTDTYNQEGSLPEELDPMGDWGASLLGPQGVALVKAWPDGRTDTGWGLNPAKPGGDTFMPKYMKNGFNARSVLYGYDRDKWNFAIIMRSVKLICIDIDGKNGGFDGAKLLGALPKTLAEISKSLTGYHLFYLFEEPWDPKTGFGSLSDRIGIEQGVDIRATGCVYHHKQQRWNNRQPVALPQHLHDLLVARAERQAATQARITSVLASGDDMEILMMQDDLLSKLNKPIPSGKRNNTLFAIGSEMVTAGVKGWDEAIRNRAIDVGLDQDEIDKLIRNIGQYAPAAP